LISYCLIYLFFISHLLYLQLFSIYFELENEKPSLLKVIFTDQYSHQVTLSLTQTQTLSFLFFLSKDFLQLISICLNVFHRKSKLRENNKDKELTLSQLHLLKEEIVHFLFSNIANSQNFTGKLTLTKFKLLTKSARVLLELSIKYTPMDLDIFPLSFQSRQ
jgi:hypothetical protein